MKNQLILAVLGLVILSSSCKKVLFEEEPEKTPESLFQQTWEFADNKYSFFEFKNIDWDSVYNVYRPKIYNEMSDDSLFTVLGDMLYVLRDGHVNLSSPFDISRNWQWYLDYPPNFSEDLLDRYYFLDQEQYIGPFKVFDFGDVGYMQYGSFMAEVTEKDMKIVLDKFRSHKGLIIDLRNNGGGSVANVYTIGNHFVDKTTRCAYEKEKTGPGKNDFSAPKDLTFEPVEGNTAYSLPVVILTNRKCYSATNMLITMMSALPNVTLIGDKSGGGGGIPTYTQLSNGWIVRLSASQTFTLDDFNNEDGVHPDIKVDISETDMANHYDAILETALTYLRP